MPKIVASKELGRIVAVIRKHSDGIGVEGIANLVGTKFTRRTLQRRLAALIEQSKRRVRTAHVGRAVRMTSGHASRLLCGSRYRGSVVVCSSQATVNCVAIITTTRYHIAIIISE